MRARAEPVALGGLTSSPCFFVPLISSFCLPSPAKVLNSTFLLFNFLAWVACCVSFGGEQFSGQAAGTMVQQRAEWEDCARVVHECDRPMA
jgi:hypothetical protein